MIVSTDEKLIPSIIKQTFTFIQLSVTPAKIIKTGYKYLSIIDRGGWNFNDDRTDVYLEIVFDNKERWRIPGPFKNVLMPDNFVYFTLTAYRPSGTNFRPLFNKVDVILSNDIIDFKDIEVTPYICITGTIPADSQRRYSVGYLNASGDWWSSGLAYIKERFNSIRYTLTTSGPILTLDLISLDGSGFNDVTVFESDKSPITRNVSHHVPFYDIQLTNDDRLLDSNFLLTITHNE